MATNKKAIPAKLGDGSWGVRVEGRVTRGDVVTVKTRSGKTWDAIIEREICATGLVSLCSTQKKANEASDQARRRLERLQNDYADWRSGERASAGCPATGERYALRMRLACQEIEIKIVALMDEYPEIQAYPGQVEHLRSATNS